MSATVAVAPVPGMRVGDWLVSGAVHAAAVIALWQFATTGAFAPAAVQRLDLSVRWAAEPQAVAAVADTPAKLAAPTAVPDTPAAPVAVPVQRPAPRERVEREPDARAPVKPKASLRHTRVKPSVAKALPAPAIESSPQVAAPVAASETTVAAPVAASETTAAAPVAASEVPVPAAPESAPQIAAVAPMHAAADPASMSPAVATTPALRAPALRAPAAHQDAGRWQRDLEQLMREHKRYPLQARRMRQQGVVTVEASFSPDGLLLRCNVADSSGYRSLDEAALELVHKAAELLRSRQVPGALAELRIPIAFQLSGS